ncbi:MAG: hypothetical protein MSG64_16240 [Pyrinomonadaceae bacterium MAG19_C2-C3]|nr:hypothetical protein [Pyrinomonadaceae bacterium MAG19_C2-C3]
MHLSGDTRFSLRLPEQPIIYPVLNEDHATQIVRDREHKSPARGTGL